MPCVKLVEFPLRLKRNQGAEAVSEKDIGRIQPGRKLVRKLRGQLRPTFHQGFSAARTVTGQFHRHKPHPAGKQPRKFTVNP